MGKPDKYWIWVKEDEEIRPYTAGPGQEESDLVSEFAEEYSLSLEEEICSIRDNLVSTFVVKAPAQRIIKPAAVVKK